MRLRVSPFKSEDLAEMAASHVPGSLGWHDRRAIVQRFGSEQVRGLTFRDPISGAVLCCGGIAERHPQWGELWAFYAPGLSRKQWAQLLEMSRHWIDQLPHRRVDALVQVDQPMAVRWADRMGLVAEVTLAAAAPDGGNMLVMRRSEP